MKSLTKKPNVDFVSNISYKDTIFLAQRLNPVNILNHIFWDLVPITKTVLGKQKSLITAWMYSFDSKLTCKSNEIDKVVVFTEFWKETCIYNLPDELEPVIIPSGINVVKFSRVKPFREKEFFVVGNITNGASWKHSDDFVLLCLEIQKAIPSAKFIFLGTKDLKEKVAGLSNFQIFPPFSMEAANYLPYISILIHKTKLPVAEVLCNAIAEAMAAGIPVVAEARGGLKSLIIHGKTGFLCENNQDFVHYCKMLYEDIDLYWRMSEKARARIQSEFSLAHFRKRVKNFMSECL